MLRRRYVYILLVLVCATRAMAQETNEVEELRRLADLLQRRLAEVEQAPAASRRVTELGASSAATAAPQEPEQVTRAYDVGDLFAIAPPYPALRNSDLDKQRELLFPATGTVSGGTLGGGGAGLSGGGFGGGGFGGGGGFFAVPSAGSPENRPSAPPHVLPQSVGPFPETVHNTFDEARVSLDGLVDAITSVIDPELWESAGGSATITSIGTTLLVNAKPATHEKIQTLLDSFRERWGTLRTVSLRAYWVWLDDEQLDDLLAGGRPKEEGIARTSLGVVEETAFERLLKETDGQNSPPSYRAFVTGFNGQTFHALAGAQQVYVTGVTPVVSGNGGPVGYAPQSNFAQLGVALQVTPLVSTRGPYVTLDVHSRVALLAEQGDESKQPVPEQLVPETAPLVSAAAVDRPRIEVQRLSTTLRTGFDQTLLVGGMTFQNRGDVQNRALYLFLKTSVQELQDKDEP